MFFRWSGFFKNISAKYDFNFFILAQTLQEQIREKIPTERVLQKTIFVFFIYIFSQPILLCNFSQNCHVIFFN